jgi:phage-related protein
VKKIRELYFFKDYFYEFYFRQKPKVKKKIVWTLKVIEEVERIPEVYFKHLDGSEGIYEIRIQVGNEIFRIFSFFDKGSLIIIGHGFQKKSQKIPHGQLEMAEKIRKEYYEEK